VTLYWVYFRFGGTEYPPMILFKVFIKCGENGVKYYSGKKMIRAASKVVFESLNIDRTGGTPCDWPLMIDTSYDWPKSL
jgi:hypothetical protein